MAKKTVNNLKLGLFVLAGLLLLITALYFIGKDSNFFGRNYRLRAQFENVQGLSAGNNIRYAGIQVGTVKTVRILNDSLIEVTLLIRERMKSIIHKGDQVSISTDGLMGNKLLNIIPAKDGSPLAADGDLLPTRSTLSTENMLETLDRTNRNILAISEDLKATVQRVQAGKGLWSLLEDETLPANLRASALAIRRAAENASHMAATLNNVVNNIQNGKGSLGAVLADTSIARNLSQAVAQIKNISNRAGNIMEELNAITSGVRRDIDRGGGAVNTLLKDTVLPARLQASLLNIQQGTAAFNETMEALQHNFLLRGYFKKQEKQRKKELENKLPNLTDSRQE